MRPVRTISRKGQVTRAVGRRLRRRRRLLQRSDLPERDMSAPVGRFNRRSRWSRESSSVRFFDVLKRFFGCGKVGPMVGTTIIGRHVPLLGPALGDLSSSDRSVFRSTPTVYGEGRRLRQFAEIVQNDECRSHLTMDGAVERVEQDLHRMNAQGESQQSVRLLATRGILREAMTPAHRQSRAISRMKIWSVASDVASIGSQARAKFLVG